MPQVLVFWYLAGRAYSRRFFGPDAERHAAFFAATLDMIGIDYEILRPARNLAPA
jgi:hypothetical protein